MLLNQLLRVGSRREHSRQISIHTLLLLRLDQQLRLCPIVSEQSEKAACAKNCELITSTIVCAVDPFLELLAGAATHE